MKADGNITAAAFGADVQRRGLDIPVGQKHWHGATATAAMTHIAITKSLDGNLQGAGGGLTFSRGAVSAGQRQSMLDAYEAPGTLDRIEFADKYQSLSSTAVRIIVVTCIVIDGSPTN